MWEQTSVTKPHLAYMLLGGFITVFSLVSLFIKEKLYIGEATVATAFGVIMGPVAAGIFDPISWTNSDYLTLELSRIIIVIQVFAVGVELPKKYMKRHWKGIFIMLVPVMTLSWLICTGFIYALIPGLSFVDSLVVAATLAPTDPVLASSVVGKGKFAERVPGHIRNLLSCESGCNDGMAFPFLYLGLYILIDHYKAGPAIKEWVLITILYECLFGVLLGVIIGYGGRRLIRFAESHNLIDRESFLAFYFVLAIFCAGVGTLVGTDDFLVAFSAGTAFAWDGWFSKKTEESHVSNVIDLLLNMAYFVYFGAVIPWNEFTMEDVGVTPWRLIVVSILIVLFRRAPGVMATYKWNPDIRNWREASFVSWFGPMGVGAIFFALLARAELQTESQVPAGRLSGNTEEHYELIDSIFPIVSCVVLASIIVHGSSVAVFTLGKHINTYAMTMTFTRDTDDPNWLQRLPRLEMGQSMTFSRARSRDRSRSRARVEDSAIGNAKKPEKIRHRGRHLHRKSSDLQEKTSSPDSPEESRGPDEEEADGQTGILGPGHEVYQEGDEFVVEDEMGEVIKVVSARDLDREAAHNVLSKHPKAQQLSREEREQAASDEWHPHHKHIKPVAHVLKSKSDSSHSDESKTLGSNEAEEDQGNDVPETNVERRRRQSALNTRNDSIDEEADDEEETPAERKRRLQALGHSVEEGASRPESPDKRPVPETEDAASRLPSIRFHASVNEPAVPPPAALRGAVSMPQPAVHDTSRLGAANAGPPLAQSHSRGRSIVWADKSASDTDLQHVG
ncbi:Sodium/hydrogen exchanger family-domain-containing protein [Protomyces lactucae-debilis]|uniref:Sodium/hydrogen exchanger family-domain-containing protein n=1 Tax=Protomyces lactucae-debilis TaxID=2754530 RepID=A0A1Y2EWQ0_PROLT|nr:Sodium/hydrogen exchanger family-domain-containing protein [Protomyces lactucae-debilis]ORY76032.1 Sodium/hydrogen exchanger family-domain-containing protein [Protomyces lactucae-debilis]